MPSVDTQPWEELAALIDSGPPDALAMFVNLLPPELTPYAIGQLDETRRTALFHQLARVRADLAADLLEHFADELAADIVEELSPESAAAIVDEMDSDEQTDLLAELDEDDAEAILAKMDPEEATDARQRLKYAADTAGGLMITEFYTSPADRDIDAAIVELRARVDEAENHEARYLYVIDEQDRPVGAIDMRRLVLAPRGRRLRDLTEGDMSAVAVTAPLDELEDLFDRVDYSAAPVVDDQGKLCGVVQRSAVQEALRERSTEDFLKFGGIVGGEEFRTMPLSNRWARRFAFLAPNILLSTLSVSIISAYEPVIARITALAIFLPLVANLSGAAGNQAVAVSIRELTLGLVLPRDVWRVLRKEMWLGLFNGLAIGAVLVVITLVKQGDLPLAAIIGAAFALNGVLAVCLGGAIPLGLRKVGVDPAMMSSPILTTLTDMGAFFITLTLAATLLHAR